jgi:thiamine biosynthesis lipoprotein
MRRSKIIMGTGITLDIPNAKDDVIFESVFKLLEDIDRRFSTYKKDSEVSRFARGELKQRRLSRDLKKVIKSGKSAQAATDGAFSLYAGDIFDPSGYVKGWAIERASRIIEKKGYKTYCLSAGGDMKAVGDKTWRIGVQNPVHKNKIIATIEARDLAVATSGNYERGNHIINPKTQKPADKLSSVTVIGPNIITADVLATAAFVLGDFALNFIGGQAKGYEALVVDKKGKIRMSAGMRSYLS